MKSADTRAGAATGAALGSVAVAALFVAAFVLVDKIFVQRTRGQQVDDAGLAGSVLGRARVIADVDRILNVVSVSGLVVAVIAVAAIGIARRRPALAVLGISLLATANISTQLLKTRLLHRPDLGVDQSAGFVRNTLPSGHTTAAISVAAALLLVVPPRARGTIAVLGAVTSTAIGVSTLSAGWHRPSDAIAACLVVGGWGAALCAITIALTGSHRPLRSQPIAGLGLLSIAALACLGAGSVALTHVGQVPEATGRRHLLLAYAGGGALVAGTVLATLAILTVVAHQLEYPRTPARGSFVQRLPVTGEPERGQAAQPTTSFNGR